ncbi:MAG: twin-arginine translocase TatA/TatE family subunit [Nitrospirota bacterium]
MFDIGLPELIVIFVVALLVFGPKGLPEFGRTLGKGLGELKRAFQDVKDQVETEFKETDKTLGSVLKDNGSSTINEKPNDDKHTIDKKPV